MISPTSQDVCTVISVLPLTLRESKPLIPASYIVPACRDVAKGCSTLVVMRGKFPVYIDETRPALIIPEPADNIAQSICRDFKAGTSHYVPEESEPGLFWVRGGYDEKEALGLKDIAGLFEKYRRLQQTWFSRLVAEGDDDWGKFHMRRMISDLQRIAAKSLGLDREWDIELEIGKVVRMVQCKFCRADVHPEAIICLHCRGILDMARYKTEFVSAESIK